MNNHSFTRSMDLVRRFANEACGGQADVFAGTVKVATIWDTDADRPTALYIDTGLVSEERSRAAMDALQTQCSGRLRWVANPAKW